MKHLLSTIIALIIFSATPASAFAFSVSNVEFDYTTGSFAFDYSDYTGGDISNESTAIHDMDEEWGYNSGESVCTGGSTGNGSCSGTMSETNAGFTCSDVYVQIYGYNSGTYKIDNLNNPDPSCIAPVQIVADPSSSAATVGSPFNVDVKVESGASAFNAVRANVSVSENLTVNSISNPTSNACNLHYTTTPTNSNPSFAGAIFGDSSENCNVYSMVITPNEEGMGTITFTNGSVKAYGDNSEILIGVQNASFTIADGPTATPTPDLGFTIASILPTYNATYPLTGTKLTTITSIFVNGEDTDSTYPTSTSWENIVDLSLGENTFTVYGSDGTNQTATQTVIVDRHTLGDINGDGEIDLIDASLFAVDWDKTEDLTYNLSDMNDDGVVDLTDLSILAKLQ